MKLLLEGFVLTLVVAFWVGGLAALGGYSVAHQPRPPAGTAATYIVACEASERGTAAGTGRKGAAGRRPYLRPHIATSRHPGVAPSERMPRWETTQQEAWQPRAP